MKMSFMLRQELRISVKPLLNSGGTKKITAIPQLTPTPNSEDPVMAAVTFFIWPSITVPISAIIKIRVPKEFKITQLLQSKFQK